MEAIQIAADGNYAAPMEASVNSIIVRLTQTHRELYGVEGSQLDVYAGIFDGDVPKYRVKQIYEQALTLGMTVSAIYNGEATFVGENGELLKNPRLLNSN